MSKYLMVVQSQAREGRDDEYNKWYDEHHLAEICAVPGVKSGHRLEATPICVGNPGLRYLTIYELDVDDPGTVLAEIGKRTQQGAMTQSDALDAAGAVLWIYKARS